MNDTRPGLVDVRIAVGPDGDAAEVAEATAQLRRELLDLDVEAVDVPRLGEAPPGTRGAELAELGALIVTLGQSQLLQAVLATVRSWLAGSANRRVKLELGGDTLELTGVSSDEQRRLADAWLRRHARQ